MPFHFMKIWSKSTGAVDLQPWLGLLFYSCADTGAQHLGYAPFPARRIGRVGMVAYGSGIHEPWLNILIEVH